MGDVEISGRIPTVADQKTVAPRPRRFAQVPILRTLSVCGEVAERLKAAVC
jgi:hypothetical protein